MKSKFPASAVESPQSWGHHVWTLLWVLSSLVDNPCEVILGIKDMQVERESIQSIGHLDACFE